jgi:hypothetical protein
LIDKGVSVEQVAQVTRNFTESGIMVHSYLMYGYPTQTVQETIDSLEMVRQLFELGIIQSGFWHQFALTAHSPVGLDPESFKIDPHLAPISFANNDVQFTDRTGIDHDKFSFGLKKSLFNFMHGIGFDLPLNEWFDFKIPRTKIAPNYITDCLESEPFTVAKPTSKPLFLGGTPQISHYTKSKRGATWEMTKLIFHGKSDWLEIALEREYADWFVAQIPTLSIHHKEKLPLAHLKSDFETSMEDFEAFWYSKQMLELRNFGLLVG